MARNIVIYSDGTGQRGGILVDERRSNIYKLFRATRVGPDSAIDPAEQIAFYDPGLGTLPGGVDSPAALARSFYNLASRATGLGITANIIDCYAALVRLWRPGDRIFLFGFSRGAYTVRCLGGVLRLCGIPTVEPGGQPLRRDAGSARRIARAAVAIYNYTNSRPRAARTERQAELLHHRDLLAARFRRDLGSDGTDGGNARPHFIGVFDTVASLANPAALALLALIALAAIAGLSLASIWLPGGYWRWFATLTAGAAAAALIASLVSRFKAAGGLDGVPWWRTVHFASWRMQMYDTELDPAVAYARHALSIDEARAAFARVPWGQPGQWRGGDPLWFEQLWFAGNHSDVGGSYAEVESRLSDIALDWMAGAATAVGLRIDPAVLHLHPDPAGMQHDETRRSIFRFARRQPRSIRADAALHPSVLDRLRLPAVQQYDVSRPYRPANLRNHRQAATAFDASPV
ncbi:MAG: DUF2235 domain-containing protein [Sphingomonas fennica]